MQSGRIRPRNYDSKTGTDWHESEQDRQPSRAATPRLRARTQDQAVVTFNEIMKCGDRQSFREHLDRAWDILGDKTELLQATTQSGETLFHRAATLFEHLSCRKLKAAMKEYPKDNKNETPLHYACRSPYASDPDDSGSFKVALLEVISPEQLLLDDETGSKPLHIAAMSGNKWICETLIKQAANTGKPIIDVVDSAKRTALHKSIKYKQTKITKLLLEEKAALDIQDINGRTPLHEACYMDNDTSVSDILTEMANLSNRSEILEKRDNSDQTAFHVAVLKCNHKIIEHLQEAGADITRLSLIRAAEHYERVDNQANSCIHKIITGELSSIALDEQDHEGFTALHHAAVHDNDHFAKDLLQVNSNLKNLTSDEKETPLMVAIRHGSTKVAKLLLQQNEVFHARPQVNNKHEHIIHMAVIYNRYEILKDIFDDIKSKQGNPSEMIDNMLNIKSLDQKKLAPIHHTVLQKNMEIFDLLVENKADLNQKSGTGQTAFLIAAKLGQIEIMKKIHEIVPSLEDDDEYRYNALLLAAKHGHVDIIKWIKREDRNRQLIHTRSHDGRTALHHAAANGNNKVLRVLLNENFMNCMLEDRDENRMTPLLLAARNGRIETVRFLIENGSDVYATSHKKNCLDFAIDIGNSDLAHEIIVSDAWHEALTKCLDEHSLETHPPPLRNLIRYMPEVAHIAMTRCIEIREGGEQAVLVRPHAEENLNTEFKKKANNRKEIVNRDSVVFNFEFLDDTHIDYVAMMTEKKGTDIIRKPHMSEFGRTAPAHLIKKHHPLTYLVKYNHGAEENNLFDHPLVLALIRHKWNVTRRFYLLFLGFYWLFLSMLTAYLTGIPRGTADVANSTCPYDSAGTNLVPLYWIIMLFCLLGITKEIFQIVLQKKMYHPANTVLWIVYITTVISLSPWPGWCTLDEKWQWQLATCTVLLAWLRGIYFLRFLPHIGLYVIMIYNIFYECSKAALVIILIIFAFGTSHYMMFYKQTPFSTWIKSVVRTTVMMFGEFDYTDIFHNDEQPLRYPVLSYILFYVFLIVMVIVVFNLMIALAVEDVRSIKRRARIEMMSLLINLGLSIELACRGLPFDKHYSIRMKELRNIQEIRLLSDSRMSRYALRDQCYKVRRELNQKIDDITKKEKYKQKHVRTGKLEKRLNDIQNVVKNLKRDEE